MKPLSTDEQNLSLFLQKAMGFEFAEADILSVLYALGRAYNANLSLLIPILQGMITLKENDENGKIILHTGSDKGRRYYSVEVRRILETVLDET